METYTLHYSPDNGQTTHLSSERINLIGALSNITEKAFDGIGRLNATIHSRWKQTNEVGSQRVASTLDSDESFSKIVTL